MVSLVSKANRSLRRRRGEGDLNYLFRISKRAPAALRAARAKANAALSERKSKLAAKQAEESAKFREEFERKEADYLAAIERKNYPAGARYEAKRINPKTGKFY